MASSSSSSSKKRKINTETSGGPRPSAPEADIANKVYILTSLFDDPYIETERKIHGTYLHLATANIMARRIYNKHFASMGKAKKGTASKPELREVEEEGYSRATVPDDGGDIDADEIDGEDGWWPRLRKDGGLRYGGQDQEGGLCVVWVEKRDVDTTVVSDSEDEVEDYDEVEEVVDGDGEGNEEELQSFEGGFGGDTPPGEESRGIWYYASEEF